MPTNIIQALPPWEMSLSEVDNILLENLASNSILDSDRSVWRRRQDKHVFTYKVSNNDVHIGFVITKDDSNIEDILVRVLDVDVW